MLFGKVPEMAPGFGYDFPGGGYVSFVEEVNVAEEGSSFSSRGPSSPDQRKRRHCLWACAYSLRCVKIIESRTLMKSVVGGRTNTGELCLLATSVLGRSLEEKSFSTRAFCGERREANQEEKKRTSI